MSAFFAGDHEELDGSDGAVILVRGVVITIFGEDERGLIVWRVRRAFAVSDTFTFTFTLVIAAAAEFSLRIKREKAGG